MSANHARDLDALFHRLQRAGWHIHLTRAGHYRCHGPAGQLVFCASTPSDRRALANIRSRFRRAGAKL